MHILFLYDKLMPTVEIMQNCFAAELVSEYGIIPRFVCIRHVKKSDIEDADVVEMIRPNTLLDFGVVEMAKASGRTVVSFLDDDLMNVPNDYSLMLHNVPWRKKALRKIIGITDLFVSSNSLLCEKYGTYMKKKNTLIQDTIVDESDIKKAEYTPKEDGSIKIIYAAGKNHESFFNRCISPILPDLFMRYGDRLSIAFFGSSPSVPESCVGRRIEYVDHMPLSEYRKRVADGNYDIGLAPLESNDFTKCKYYNKFIEYSVSGIPAIYSDVVPFSLIVKNGINGILADNTPSGWLSSIIKLIDDEALRKKCGDNAISEIKSNFSREFIVSSFVTELQKILLSKKRETVRGSIFIIKLLYALERVAEIVFQITIYLKYTGVKSTIAKCREHLLEFTSDKGRK